MDGLINQYTEVKKRNQHKFYCDGLSAATSAVENEKKPYFKCLCNAVAFCITL